LVCLLFVVSFGWYLFVWAYKTWKFIRQESGQAISPTLRTASLVVPIVHDIFLFQLFKYVVDLTAEADAEGDSPLSRRMPEFDSKMVAFWAGFSFLSYFLGVRGPLSLIGLASVFFLVPIQMRINRHWLRTYNIQPRRVPVVVWVVLVPLALFAVAIRVAS
jgi:hypothetical protein